MNPEKIKQIVKKYRFELLIGIFTTFLSIIITYLISFFTKAMSPMLLLVFAFGIFVVFLLGAILFNQKRLLEAKFKQILMVLLVKTKLGRALKCISFLA